MWPRRTGSRSIGRCVDITPALAPWLAQRARMCMWGVILPRHVAMKVDFVARARGIQSTASLTNDVTHPYLHTPTPVSSHLYTSFFQVYNLYRRLFLQPLRPATPTAHTPFMGSARSHSFYSAAETPAPACPLTHDFSQSDPFITVVLRPLCRCRRTRCSVPPGMGTCLCGILAVWTGWRMPPSPRRA